MASKRSYVSSQFHQRSRIANGPAQKVRATWNKYNLYNLSRLIPLNTTHKTFYQQKWYAKSASRAYHGEHIREGQWQRMFRPRMQAVVPMDHKYLAENDGSEQATGRGSGQEKEMDGNSHLARGRWKIPYLHMTYAPIERRLDMAVWRSLFASSARQARQFCIHGKVKVNGQVV
jgi:ribosomal protein S4